MVSVEGAVKRETPEFWIEELLKTLLKTHLKIRRQRWNEWHYESVAQISEHAACFLHAYVATHEKGKKTFCGIHRSDQEARGRSQKRSRERYRTDL